jgi:hypothetical protein
MFYLMHKLKIKINNNSVTVSVIPCVASGGYFCEGFTIYWRVDTGGYCRILGNTGERSE